MLAMILAFLINLDFGQLLFAAFAVTCGFPIAFILFADIRTANAPKSNL